MSCAVLGTRLFLPSAAGTAVLSRRGSFSALPNCNDCFPECRSHLSSETVVLCEQIIAFFFFRVVPRCLAQYSGAPNK